MKPLASRTHTTSPTPANPGEVTTNVSNTATLKNMTSDYPKSYDSLVAYAFELYDVPSDTETEWAVPKRPYSDAGRLKRKRVQLAPVSTPTPTALLVPDTITFATNAPGPCGHNGVGCASACSESVAVEVVDVPAPLKTKKFIKGDKNRAKGDVFLNKKGCYVQWNGFNNGPLCQSCAVVGVAVRAGYKDEHGNLNRLCSDHAKDNGTHELQNPCRDCPDGAKIAASYKDEDGCTARLCSDHSKVAGTYDVRHPCRDCPDDAKIEAAYRDEDGNAHRLCSDHAKAVGTHEVQQPCRDCPDDAKIQASYKDEDGNPARLCSDHAKAVGTYEVQHPCRDCPDDAKIEASYKDEEGYPNRLCSDHAKAAETHEVQHPCRDCPDGAKLHANYKDEDGNLQRLCSDHAKAVGTYEVQRPCRDCPDGAKLDAGYNDEDGKPQRLCADHAVAAKTHVDTGYTGGSYEACQCFDRLEKVLGITLPHIHYHLGGGHSGKEQGGLLPAHLNMTPDCYVPDPTGVSKGTIYQYHGNEWHGYPPGHPKEHEMLLCGMTGREAYEITQAKDRLYTSAGYRLFRIWGHEFAECQRARAPRNVREVCREFLG